MSDLPKLFVRITTKRDSIIAMERFKKLGYTVYNEQGIRAWGIQEWRGLAANHSGRGNVCRSKGQDINTPHLSLKDFMEATE